MIVSSGYNIAGPEVEAALLSAVEVAECAVIGVADEARGQIVQAHVVLAEGVDPDAPRGLLICTGWAPDGAARRPDELLLSLVERQYDGTGRLTEVRSRTSVKNGWVGGRM